MKKTGCLREIQSGQVSQFRSGGECREPNTAALANPHNYTLLGGTGGSPLPGEISQNMQTPGPSCGHADVQHLAQSSEASLWQEL